MGSKKSKKKKQVADGTVENAAEEAALEVGSEAPVDDDVILDEMGELKARLQRSVADLQNFRKQSEKRLADSRRFIQRDFFRDMLPIVDNFGAALMAADKGQDAESVLVGVRMIHDMMLKMLSDNGMEAIKSEGCAFDPELHDAISKTETEEVDPDVILSEVLKGWRLKDMVVRPARVVVAAAPAATDTAEDAPAEDAPAEATDKED